MQRLRINQRLLIAGTLTNRKENQMLTSLWSMKGGEGVTTAAALAAVGASAGRPTLLVDLCGDQTVMFGTGNSTAGIGDWSRGTAHTAYLQGVEIPVTDTLSILDRGRQGFKWGDGREDRLVDWLRSQRRQVIVDAGTIDPFSRNEGEDLELRKAIIHNSDRSLVVTSPGYVALRKASLNLIRPDGAIVVDPPHTPVWGLEDVTAAIDTPVVACLPYSPEWAEAPGRTKMTEFGWTGAAQQLRAAAGRPENNRIVGRTESGVYDWAPWTTAGPTEEFLKAASWAIENAWGPHEIYAAWGSVYCEEADPALNLEAAAWHAEANWERGNWRRGLWQDIEQLRGPRRMIDTNDAGAGIDL